MNTTAKKVLAILDCIEMANNIASEQRSLRLKLAGLLESVAGFDPITDEKIRELKARAVSRRTQSAANPQSTEA